MLPAHLYRQASLPAEQAVSVADLLALDLAAQREGDHEPTSAWCKRVVAADAGNMGACIERATELRELGRLDEADQVCREALTEIPDQPQALMGLGYTARQRGGATAKALQYFQSASAAAPHDPWPWLEAATELRELGRLAEAEAACHTVLSTVSAAGDAPAGHAPARWRALMELGHCARGRSDRTAALAWFTDAAATALSEPWPRLEVATELRELERIDEAEALYQDVLAEHPQAYWAVIGLGFVARHKGQSDEAQLALNAPRRLIRTSLGLA